MNSQPNVVVEFLFQFFGSNIVVLVHMKQVKYDACQNDKYFLFYLNTLCRLKYP